MTLGFRTGEVNWLISYCIYVLHMYNLNIAQLQISLENENLLILVMHTAAYVNIRVYSAYYSNY